MAASDNRLKAAVEDYFSELRRIRATGGGTGELSYYPALNNLLNAIGGSLRPKVFCVSELAQQGAGVMVSEALPLSSPPQAARAAAKRMATGRTRMARRHESGVSGRSVRALVRIGRLP